MSFESCFKFGSFFGGSFGVYNRCSRSGCGGSCRLGCKSGGGSSGSGSSSSGSFFEVFGEFGLKFCFLCGDCSFDSFINLFLRRFCFFSSSGGCGCGSDFGNRINSSIGWCSGIGVDVCCCGFEFSKFFF